VTTVGPEQLEHFRRELTGYCYRMLSSIHEAEDAVQDTLVRAWRARGRFEDRVGLRPWLYRIATNVCLDMLGHRNRRALPMALGPAGTPELALGSPRPAETWVEPAPDAVLLPVEREPGEAAVARESVRLAFVAALQHLAPRQRAVLILRDVLRWKAAEVAELLGASADAVNSALGRARAALAAARSPSQATSVPVPDPRLLARYVDAFERLDLDALVALLREDVTLAMPPYELWLHGRDDVVQWLLAQDHRRHRYRPTAANGSLAVAHYAPAGPDGAARPIGIHVLDVSGAHIAGIHVFLDPKLFTVFQVPLDR
jgi:RNA polymerase sigma-70 factor (ECF subfamily)